MPKATESRKKRIQLMREMLNEDLGKDKESISYNKFIAKFCLITGVSKRTAKEYLDLLADSGEVWLPAIVPFARGQTIHRSAEH